MTKAAKILAAFFSCRKNKAREKVYINSMTENQLEKLIFYYDKSFILIVKSLL